MIINLPKTALRPDVRLEWKVPQWSNTIERDRARSYFQAYAAACAASPRDSYGTPGPYEDAVQGQPIFEENAPENFKGIDIMRTVRSFDPCLPCGVHMYLGKGRVLERRHSPFQLDPE